MSVKARVYLDGAIAGIIGALIIAVLFLFLDTVTHLPLYTPTVMGGSLFLSADDLASTEGARVIFAAHPDVHRGSRFGLYSAGCDGGAVPFIDSERAQSRLIDARAFCDFGIWLRWHSVLSCRPGSRSSGLGEGARRKLPGGNWNGDLSLASTSGA